MNSVRYKTRECLDQEKIERFLHQTRLGYLGLVDGNLPYVVPLNYVWTEGNCIFMGLEMEDVIRSCVIIRRYVLRYVRNTELLQTRYQPKRIQLI